MFLKNKISFYLLCLFLFLLPWQTRWLYAPATLGAVPSVASAKEGGFWEYGSQSLYATELLLGLTLLIFLIEKFCDSRFRARLRSSGASKHTKLRMLELGMVVVFLSFVAGQSTVPGVTLQKLYYLLLALCVGFLIYLHRENKNALLLSLWVGGVGQAILGLWQFLTQEVVANKWLGLASHSALELGDFVVEFGDERWLRAYGAFGSPNMLGGFLAICFIVGLWLYIKTKPSFLKIIFLVGQLVITAGLMVSFSRAAWIASDAGALMFVFQAVREKTWRYEWRDFLKLCLASFVVVGVFTYLCQPLVVTRLTGRERLEVQSNTSRRAEFTTWLSIVKKNIALGTGPGLYTYSLWEQNNSLPVWRYQPIHNTFLLLVAEWGVVGLLVWGLVLRRVGFFRIRYVFWPLAAVFVVTAGLDHYYWSLYGGMMLTAVVSAFILAKKEEF